VIKKEIIDNLIRNGYYNHQNLRKSAFGKAPFSWEWKKLRELIVDGPQNGIYKPSSEYGQGTAIVELSDLYDNDYEIDFGDFRKVNVSEEEREKYGLIQEDIIINRVSKQVSGVGKALKVGFGDDAVFESNMIRFRLSEEILPEYFVYFSRSQWYSKYIDAVAKHSSQASISQDSIKNLEIPLPEKDEQRQIVEAINSVDHRMALEDEYRLRLIRFKRGIMQDLLSGTVRTTDTNIEVPEEVAQYG